MILEKTLRILKEPVCDHCLGRQFGQLLSGMTNAERGKALRMLAAMTIDQEKGALGGIAPSNVSDMQFHYLQVDGKHDTEQVNATETCSVCDDFFGTLGAWVRKARRAAKKAEFATFVVGTKLSHDLIEKEEALWESVGIDYCEPIKAEINREIGKLLETVLDAKADTKHPDVAFVLDFSDGTVSMNINPLFVYGEYQKLIRGIPQTKWPSGKYKTSVEQIIAKPFMLATKAKGHKLHGLGREDIDARCLAWRPFVLEFIGPRVRDIDAKKLAGKIGKGVKARNLRFSTIAEVRTIKELRVDKTYRALVACDGPVAKKGLSALAALHEIRQRTPARVLHRRADKVRKRYVKKLRAAMRGKQIELVVTAEAGTYIKELISGDGGRTEPSIAAMLGMPCACTALDVIGIHMPRMPRMPKKKASRKDGQTGSP